VCWRPEEWSRHPVITAKRRQQALDEPFDEGTIRRALATYYGMVTFLDDQIGLVLGALHDAGLETDTRVVYTTDHGDMLGDHGLWWKSVMYEGAAALPMLVAGPDVPAGKTVATNVSLVDAFPTIVEATGAAPAPEDADLPGQSLVQTAQADDRPRAVLSEYHAIYSPSAMFMLRDARYKYVEYVGYPPQLFDLDDDPDEAHDLAGEPATPETIDRRAKTDQARRIDGAGGVDAVLAGGVKIPFTPAPTVP
jgi:choline-sulfatase